MLRAFKADLHIHTCLSPCGDLEMLPKAIVQRAEEAGLDIIAICDHNSTENSGAVQKIGDGKIRVLAGIEIASKEEVHILGLFDSSASLSELQAIIYQNLPGENDEAAFGEQAIVNEEGDLLGISTKLLIGATSLSVKEVVGLIHSVGGIAIASHIDRPSFSIISQLGFIPEDLELDALEVSRKTFIPDAQTKRFPILFSSDAHYLQDIGRNSSLLLIEEPTIKEIKMALSGEEGRRICNYSSRSEK
ncbi:MAG: PHP domain-containing protein [Candidatus Desantisbacteria bacterium]